MKIACLVLAYAAPKVLQTTVNLLSPLGWDFFVHLDRKADRPRYSKLLDDAAGKCRFVEEPLEIFWGGYSMIKAEVKLIETALAAASYDKCLLISDDTFPLVDPQRLHDFIDSDADHITTYKQHPGSVFFERYHKFFHYDHPATMMRGRGSRLPEIDDQFISKIMEISAIKLIGKKKLDVYYGSQFWALRRQTLEQIVDILNKDQHLAKSFEFSALSDELCIQSIIGNYMPNRNIYEGPVYADFIEQPGPMSYADASALPFAYPRHCVFLRKIRPDAAALLETLSARLMSGQDIHGLDPDQAGWMQGVIGEAGNRRVSVELTAPGAGKSHPHWHGLERHRQECFRWTANSTIEWQIPTLPPAANEVIFVLPFVIPPRPAFVESSTISFNNQTKPMQRRGRALVATFDVACPTGETVRVATAEPFPSRPDQPSGRKLGIAVRAASSAVNALLHGAGSDPADVRT